MSGPNRSRLGGMDCETARIGKLRVGKSAMPRLGHGCWVSYCDRGRLVDPRLNDNGECVAHRGDITDIMNGPAIEILERRRRKPSSLFVAHEIRNLNRSRAHSTTRGATAGSDGRARSSHAAESSPKPPLRFPPRLVLPYRASRPATNYEAIAGRAGPTVISVESRVAMSVVRERLSAFFTQF